MDSGWRLLRRGVSAQRLRQSVQTYFDAPWALTYANADRLLDMRDEEMALRDDEVTGELPPDLEYEEFNEIREQLAAIIEEQLAVYTSIRWVRTRRRYRIT